MLYTVAHFKVSEFKVIPPVITKTSLPQQWHVPSRTKGIFSQLVTDLVVQNLNPAQNADQQKQTWALMKMICARAKRETVSNRNFTI